MTQRYAVPEGMLKSALDRVNDENVVEPALEAACRWLSENPIVPTDEQLWSIGQTMDGSKDKFSCSQELIEKWQRRMFVVPEPESAKCPKCGHELPKWMNENHATLEDCVPEPKVEVWGFSDLWWQGVPVGVDSDKIAELHNKQIRITWNRAKIMYSATEETEPSEPPLTQEQVCNRIQYAHERMGIMKPSIPTRSNGVDESLNNTPIPDPNDKPEPSVPEKIGLKDVEEICGEAKLSNLAKMEYFKLGGEIIHEEIPNIVWIIASSTSSMKFNETTIRALLEVYRRGQKAK